MATAAYARADLASRGRIRAGAVAWLLAMQFFLAQAIAQSAWRTPYSLTRNVISDLGRTSCGDAACSPLHGVMNGSFVIVGLTMALGAVLARGAFIAGWRRTFAVLLFIAAGLGVVMVGVYPENEQAGRHVAGAALNFVCGNAALVLFGLAADARIRAFGACSILGGAAGLAAALLLALKVDFGLGPGALERICAYTIAIWQIAAGGWLLKRIAVSRG
jgi:hypothetical membrane protein